jgi:hypothetical protein
MAERCTVFLIGITLGISLMVFVRNLRVKMVTLVSPYSSLQGFVSWSDPTVLLN